MSSLVLTATETVTAPPDEVFAMFGSGAGQGLVAGSLCDALVAGAVVTLPVPIEGNPVEVLGRISAVQPGKRIQVVHDQPWRGRIRLKFEANGPQTTNVSLVAELDHDGIEWLSRRRGWPVADRVDDGTHRIGLLMSKSGPGAVYAMASEHLAQLAVDEINADGGLRGRPVRLMVADDTTDPAVGAAEARRLLGAGCRVLIGCVTSATFSSVQHAVESSRIPLMHTVVNEGGAGPPHVFRLGERPVDQLRLTAEPLMRASGARRWFLIGEDYSWSHGAHRAARQVLGDSDATIVGERFVPLGTKDFSPAIEAIHRSGADLILSTLVGSDEVAFERQCQEEGLRDRCRTLALVLDEATREWIGDVASRGLWATFGYFQQLSTGSNEHFLQRYRQERGPWAPPVSSMSEPAYEAIQLYAAAVRHAYGDSPGDVVAELHNQRAVLPRGEVALRGPHELWQQLHFAEAIDGGFRMLGSRG